MREGKQLLAALATCLMIDGALCMQLSPSSREILSEALTVEAHAQPHQRFSEALERARAHFAEADASFSEAEIAVRGGGSPLPLPGFPLTSASPTLSAASMREAAGSALVPAALYSLSEGIKTLKRVRRDVATSTSSLSAEVKAQVLWDLDRMTADAEKLHSASLAPLARSALHKALALRFGVLLTPAFWTSPIQRSLLTST